MNTEKEEDFSLEDDQEVQKTFGGMANREFSCLIERLKRDERKNKLLYLRSLGRAERNRLRNKYAKPSSK